MLTASSSCKGQSRAPGDEAHEQALSCLGDRKKAAQRFHGNVQDVCWVAASVLPPSKACKCRASCCACCMHHLHASIAASRIVLTRTWVGTCRSIAKRREACNLQGTWSRPPNEVQLESQPAGKGLTSAFSSCRSRSATSQPATLASAGRCSSSPVIQITGEPMLPDVFLYYDQQLAWTGVQGIGAARLHLSSSGCWQPCSPCSETGLLDTPNAKQSWQA